MNDETRENDRKLYESALQETSIQANRLVRDGLNGLLSRCESPIEQRFLLGMAVVSPWIVVSEILDLPGSRLHLQHAIGPYRVDFVIEERGDPDDLKPGLLVVEIDGHEFHEKTKEQAERDKTRDRYLVSEGYTVLRFTGREVFRDAVKCAAEAWTAAVQRMIELNPGRIDPETGSQIPRQ